MIIFSRFWGGKCDIFSCKTSILQETVEKFNLSQLLALLLQEKQDFKHLYAPYQLIFLSFTSDLLDYSNPPCIRELREGKQILTAR